ncbi:MAG: hypothetical protein JWM34_4172 [Ilumatobacteraceae bacterium]|nr:hypothetical protein [Ilumatobacteraceae bacterium]
MTGSTDTVGESAYRSPNAPDTTDRDGRVIGICTDSNSQLPAALAERYCVEVVPLTVAIDDREYLEGVDLDADEFYELMGVQHPPTVQCNQPSSGQYAMAYDELVARGCTQILSIHTSAACSGTLKAARLAVHSVPVPIRLVDSGTTRFRVSCCVWAAGEAIAAGASLEEAAAIADSLAPSVGTVFIAAGPDVIDLARLAGRKVLTLDDTGARIVTQVDSAADAVNAMADFVLRWNASVPVGAGAGVRSSPRGANGSAGSIGESGRLNVAVGWAHRDMQPIAAAVAHAVGESAHVAEIVEFRIGPSVGIETGPAAVSCVMFPA